MQTETASHIDNKEDKSSKKLILNSVDIIFDFERFKSHHKYCRRYFSEEAFDPKDCMIDFALQTKIVKQSDKRLSQDNFTYTDWSLGIYCKARNMLASPIQIYKEES